MPTPPRYRDVDDRAGHEKQHEFDRPALHDDAFEFSLMRSQGQESLGFGLLQDSESWYTPGLTEVVPKGRLEEDPDCFGNAGRSNPGLPSLRFVRPGVRVFFARLAWYIAIMARHEHSQQLELEFSPCLVHAICHYHRQWIPGDERGFRSRGHRIHSSGDYRKRPPVDEHAGLRHHVKKVMKDPAVQLRFEQATVVGAAFVKKLLKMNCQVVILACGPTHLHAMFRPTENDVERQVGKAKQYASLKCPNHRGQLWAESCDVSPVEDERHAGELFGYIDDHRQEGAWIWRCDRDAPPV